MIYIIYLMIFLYIFIHLIILYNNLLIIYNIIIYDSCLNILKIYYKIIYIMFKKTYVYECIIENNNTKMKLKYSYIEDQLLNNFNQYLLYCLKDK